jgi:hypothetical protein
MKIGGQEVLYPHSPYYFNLETLGSNIIYVILSLSIFRVIIVPSNDCAGYWPSLILFVYS